MIGAIVFDFDGVILESADLKTVAFVEMFADRPEHQDAIRAHHLENLGISRYEKFRWIYANLFHEPLTEQRSAELGQQFSNLVFDKVLACPFVPGARQALDALHGTRPLYVASGTPHDELLRIIDHRGERVEQLAIGADQHRVGERGDVDLLLVPDQVIENDVLALKQETPVRCTLGAQTVLLGLGKLQCRAVIDRHIAPIVVMDPPHRTRRGQFARFGFWYMYLVHFADNRQP